MLPPSPHSANNAPQFLESLWDGRTPCPFDEIVDVRSPAEYADDHFPGSINLPVLDNPERIEVGTIYRREGAFAAAKIGAAYISSNIASHLRTHFSEKRKGYRPLLYCWRGGQRSTSLGIVLSRIGWRTTILKGGYKTYRAHVRRELETVPPSFEYRIVSGPTGSGKTRLLHALAAGGAQVLDLEGLAAHRGSVLGGIGFQPSQKRFDSRLKSAFDSFVPSAPIWVEAESSRIGDVYLPAALWDKMRAAGGVDIRMPLEARVRHLVSEYANLIARPAELKEKLRLLVPKHGRGHFEAWCGMAEAEKWRELAESLLLIHYDPAYTVSTDRYYPNVTASETLLEATPEAVCELAAKLHPAAGERDGPARQED